MATTHRSRATLARRGAAVRTFFAWASRTHRVPVDPALRLATARTGSTLPTVLRVEPVTQMLDLARDRAADGDAVALRDWALLELLYATGVRVGEVCGADLGDLDVHERTLRVVGKGDKERVVPFGKPAATALSAWLERGRPQLVHPDVAVGRLPRPARGPPRPAPGAHGRPPGRRPRGRRRRGAARAASHRRDPPPRGWLGPAQRPGDPRSRQPGHDAALHPRLGRPPAVGLPASAPPSMTHTMESTMTTQLDAAFPVRTRMTSTAPEGVIPQPWPAAAAEVACPDGPDHPRGAGAARTGRAEPFRRGGRRPVGGLQVVAVPAGARGPDPALRAARVGRRRPGRHAPAQHRRAGRPRLVRHVRPDRRASRSTRPTAP